MNWLWAKGKRKDERGEDDESLGWRLSAREFWQVARTKWCAARSHCPIYICLYPKDTLQALPKCSEEKKIKVEHRTSDRKWPAFSYNLLSYFSKKSLWSFSPPARTFGTNYIWIWGVGHQCSMIFDIRSYYFYARSTWDSKWKSVGEENIQTILDKCDVRYSTLIFSIQSTWAGPQQTSPQGEADVRSLEGYDIRWGGWICNANIGWYVVSKKWHHFWEIPQPNLLGQIKVAGKITIFLILPSRYWY